MRVLRYDLAMKKSCTRPNSIVATCFASTLAVSTLAQTPTWNQVITSTAPSVTSTTRMVTDTARQEIVYFGGSLGETWTWSSEQWVQQSPTTSPQPRVFHAMAFDSARQRVVLFGGSNGPSYWGTWEWDGADWAYLSAPGPVGREGHAMAYDAARQRVVLFGGQPVPNTFPVRNDVWEWDGTSWHQPWPQNTPPARRGHAMAYDPQSQRVIVFGGMDNNGTALADTWEWDGTDWIARFTPTYPPARHGHAMTFDPSSQSVVLFGGRNGGDLADTWEWDGVAWTESQPLASPPAQHGHALAYDPDIELVVLHGGGQTWVNGTIPPPPTPSSAVAYGTGCGSPALTFTPAPSGPPIIGQVTLASIENAPVPVGAVAMGWSDEQFGPFSLPVTLAGVGMPGCSLLQSSEIIDLPVAQTGANSMQFGFAVPDMDSLLGVHVFVQAYALAPNENPAWIIVSNGIDLMFGDA